MDVAVRLATEGDLDFLCDLMVQEDWNADIRYLRKDLRCHPDGTIVAEDKESGNIVGMIMGLRFGADYGFGCGFLVAAQHRGKGIGSLLWKRRLEMMTGRSWALDAVPDRVQPNIRKGFNPPVMEIKAYRWTGKPQHCDSETITCCTLKEGLIERFVAYDAKTHPGGERGDYLNEFLKMDDIRCTVALEEGTIKGFLMAFPGLENTCAGILKADSVHAADCLLSDVSNEVEGTISIQIPMLNKNVLPLIEKYNMEEWYILNRMWMGKQPDFIDYSQIYAVPQSAI